MSSANWQFSAPRAAIFGAAVLFAAGAAHAQVAVSPDEDTHAAAVSAAESSSNDSPLYSSSLDASSSMDAAEPAAPAPSAGAAGAGGQYDNNARTSNSGWKSRMAFEAGGGFNAPSSDSGPYITWGGNLTVGAGLHVNKMLSVLAEYQFIDDKLPGRVIAQTGATGGNAHIWSLTLAPVIDLMPKSATGVYVTGGGGFYRKVTNFTDPQEQLYCSYYYCSPIVTNAVVGHFSSNQGGWNVGGGIRHRFAGMYGDGRMEVFAEARYLDVMTPAVTSSPNGLGTVGVGADTKLIPVTFGVRF